MLSMIFGGDINYLKQIYKLLIKTKANFDGKNSHYFFNTK